MRVSLNKALFRLNKTLVARFRLPRDAILVVLTFTMKDGFTFELSSTYIYIYIYIGHGYYTTLRKVATLTTMIYTVDFIMSGYDAF